MSLLRADDLIVLMALARNNHDVSLAGPLHRVADRLFPVRNYFMIFFREPIRDIPDNLLRVLGPGIIARDDHHV